MDTFLGGPYNKDYSMLGSVLGSPLKCLLISYTVYLLGMVLVF